MKRQTEKIWKIGGGYFRTNTGLDKVDKWDRTLLYYVTDGSKNYYFDGSPDRMLQPSEVDYRFALNPTDPNDFMDMGGRENPYASICTKCDWEGEITDLCPRCGSKVETKFGDTFGRIEAIRNVEKVNALYLGPGVIADVAYRVRTKSYVVEETNKEVVDAKKNWQTAVKALDDWVAHPSMKPSDYDKAVANVNTTYNKFVTTLEKALKNERG